MSKVKSLSPNAILNLSLQIQINNYSLFPTPYSLTLLPDALWQSKFYWNTGTNTPGEYTVTQTIFYKTGAISISTCTFTIIPTSEDLKGILGNITCNPKEVKTYGSLTVDYNVRNTGNSDLINLPINILIIDPETKELKHTITDIATITQGGSSYTNAKIWIVDLKEPKIYLAILQAQSKSLAKDNFKVLPYGFLYGTVTEDVDSPACLFAVFSDGPQRYLGGGCDKETIVKDGSIHSNTKATINSRKKKIVDPPYIMTHLLLELEGAIQI